MRSCCCRRDQLDGSSSGIPFPALHYLRFCQFGAAQWFPNLCAFSGSEPGDTADPGHSKKVFQNGV